MATKLKSVGDELDAIDAEREANPLLKLREQFPAHHISKLPKETKAQTEERKNNRSSGISCSVCGGWHHKNAIHLDYVGHAALTDRLLDTDLHWSWEPVAFNADGLPALDRNGGLWIKLTICDVTRLGYGAADGKSGGDAVKEIIGDALRNAAMRFGAALDLWHKGDLHLEEEEEAISDKQRDELLALAQEVSADVPRFCRYFRIEQLSDLPASQYHEAVKALEAKRQKDPA